MDYDLLAPLYDAQYRDYRDDLALYGRLATDYGAPVLELGAGSARVSAALARAGHAVVAVERSSAMIRRGEARLAHEGLAGRVRYQQADMRELMLGTRFPLVIAPFNTLMHLYTLNDQDAALAAARAHLAPGGLFAFDLYNPVFHGLDRLRREAEWDHVGGEHAELFLYQSLDEDAQVLETRYYLDHSGEDGLLRRETAVLKQRYFYRFELERALLGAGFTHLQFYGSFARERYHAGSSHLVCLARSES